MKTNNTRSPNTCGGFGVPLLAAAAAAVTLAACGGGGGSSGSPIPIPSVVVTGSTSKATYAYIDQPSLSWVSIGASQVDLTACTAAGLNATNIGLAGNKQFASAATTGTYTCTLRAVALDGSVASQAVTWSVAAPAAATLVASVPAPSYSTGDGRIDGFNYLNGARGRCGWGMLKDDTRLDQAAADHAHYMASNMDVAGKSLNDVGNHVETVGWLNFTGVTATDRAAYRGYPTGYVGELLSAGGGPTATYLNFFDEMAASFIGTVYHGFGALGASIDIGMAYEASSTSAFFVFNPGAPSSIGDAQLPAGDAVQTYPCEGESGIATAHGGEIPNPLPSRNWTTDPVGAPILIAVRQGQVLSVSSVTMAPAGGAALTGTLITSDTDVNKYLQPHQAAWLPDGRLQKSTVYSVTIKGTNSGIPFTKSFSFTTWNQT